MLGGEVKKEIYQFKLENESSVILPPAVGARLPRSRSAPLSVPQDKPSHQQQQDQWLGGRGPRGPLNAAEPEVSAVAPPAAAVAEAAPTAVGGGDGGPLAPVTGPDLCSADVAWPQPPAAAEPPPR